MNDPKPNPVDKNSKRPQHPDQMRGNVYFRLPSDMNAKALVNSIHLDLQDEGIFVGWRQVHIKDSNTEMTFLALLDQLCAKGLLHVF